MSHTTTAHKVPVHIPWTPILAALITALIAAAVIYAVNHNATTIQSASEAVPTSTVTVPLPETAVERQALLAGEAASVSVPLPETRVQRQALIAAGQAAAHTPPMTTDYAPSHVPLSAFERADVNGAGETATAPGPRNPHNPFWRTQFPVGL